MLHSNVGSVSGLWGKQELNPYFLEEHCQDKFVSEIFWSDRCFIHWRGTEYTPSIRYLRPDNARAVSQLHCNTKFMIGAGSDCKPFISTYRIGSRALQNTRLTEECGKPFSDFTAGYLIKNRNDGLVKDLFDNVCLQFYRDNWLISNSRLEIDQDDMAYRVRCYVSGVLSVFSNGIGTMYMYVTLVRNR